jgi:hypothetical protein
VGVGDAFGAEVMRMNGGGGAASCGAALQAEKMMAETRMRKMMKKGWDDFMSKPKKNPKGFIGRIVSDFAQKPLGFVVLRMG